MKELDVIAKTPPPLDDNTNAADVDGRKEDDSDIMASTARCIRIGSSPGKTTERRSFWRASETDFGS
jgi:hypothetical protein